MALLAGADESLSDVAFQYGRNVGLAFQLVDDLLDFVSSSAAMGKPTAADLKLGLATAPVLFACERVRKLNCRKNNNIHVNNQIDAQFFLVCLFLFYTCFGQPCAHHQENYCINATPGLCHSV